MTLKHRRHYITRMPLMWGGFPYLEHITKTVHFNPTFPRHLFRIFVFRTEIIHTSSCPELRYFANELAGHAFQLFINLSVSNYTEATSRRKLDFVETVEICFVHFK